MENEDNGTIRKRMLNAILKNENADAYYKGLHRNTKRIVFLKYRLLKMTNERNLDKLVTALHSLRKEVWNIRTKTPSILSADVYSNFIRDVKDGKQCLNNLGFDENGKFILTNDMVGIDDAWMDLEIAVRDIETELRIYNPENYLNQLKPPPQPKRQTDLGGGLMLATYKVPLFNTLVNDKDIIEAEHSRKTIRDVTVKFNNAETAKHYLLHECGICTNVFVMDSMETLICGCEMCKDCFVEWITNCVNTKQVDNWKCPIEDHPFDAEMLAALVDTRPELKSIRIKFHMKLNIYGIMFETSFRWCAHGCENGFLFDQPGPKMQCPAKNCKKFTCKDCKKKWNEDHDNRTCEEFEAFKIANDPDIAKALSEIGVQCPSCKMRYEVARGGCMHFTCRTCKYQFCCGCYNEMFDTKVKECPHKCIGKGLHAHHPRNCMYFLRDWNIPELEDLLKVNKIDYTPGQIKKKSECSVVITDQHLRDYECGKKVVKFDFCSDHLKEYLVTKINQNNLEPIDKMPLIQVELVLTREKLTPPPKVANEKNDAYLTRLRQHVKQILPLEKLK